MLIKAVVIEWNEYSYSELVVVHNNEPRLVRFYHQDSKFRAGIDPDNPDHIRFTTKAEQSFTRVPRGDYIYVEYEIVGDKLDVMRWCNTLAYNRAQGRCIKAMRALQ